MIAAKPSSALLSKRPRVVSVRASSTEEEPSTPSAPSTSSAKPETAASVSRDILAQNKKKTSVETPDMMATALTRRFGLAGGLAWFAVLAAGSLGEQVKTRIEVANEEKNTKDVDNAKEVVLRSGVRYKDLRIGGGQNPDKGLLAVINYRGKIVETGDIFEDTFARGKPIVYLFGGRPFQAGMCAGLEEALKTMKAGGRRIVTVPSELGFGAAGGFIQSTRHAGDKAGQIPPNSTLEYEVVLERVSIPPS